MQKETIFIASDHAGYALKQCICDHLSTQGRKVEDLGTHSEESCDYPVFAHKLCAKVLENDRQGILICGTGTGMSMAANRHPGIRAALCTHEFQAKFARAHNNANVLCLAGRISSPTLACAISDLFLEQEFEDGRHSRRVELIEIQKVD
ncbi:MAG: ribose 5-phosphate isomerase B [Desulfovibrio sp.]|jgi:ribose 5-phosphate isomerase B|nr:ribose 5-phosphate isomerase B [Desulfovibrio sp.]